MGTPATAAPPPPPPPPQTQTDSLPRPSFTEQRPSFASPRPSFSDPRPSFADPHPRPSFSDQRPAFPEPRNSYSASQHNSKLPTLHPLQTTQSPPPGHSRPNVPYSSYPSQPSSAYEASAPHSAGPMNPNYGYSQYPPNYPLSAPAPSGPSSGYPPSASTYSAPSRYPPPSWATDKADLARMEEKKIGHSSLAPYGESVKRHLESFDLEASLNEVCILSHAPRLSMLLTTTDGGRLWTHYRLFKGLPTASARKPADWHDPAIHAKIGRGGRHGEAQ